MNRKRKEKLKWWSRFWPPTIISYLILIVVQCILYLLGYIDISQLSGGVLVVLAVTPLVYAVWYLKTRTSRTTRLKINRIAFIVVGGFVAWVITFFGVAFTIWTMGLPPPTDLMGPWPTFIVIFIVPWVVGGFIGEWLGKRRNYRPFM